MNLKTFHFVFILASAFIAFLFAGWEWANYRALHDGGALAGVIIASAVGLGLLVYSVVFKRKSRRLIV